MKHGYKYIIAGMLIAISSALNSQIPMAWQERYNAPPDMTDESRSIVVDASGNIYVTGSGFNSGGNLDAITIKYDQDGNQMWVRNFDRGINDNDEGRMIALDAAGNVYITGYSRGNGTSLDAMVVKYDNAGNQQWASFYNGTYNGIDEGRSIAVNSAGDVFMCGYTSDSLYYFNTLTVKYNSAGTQQWATLYAGALGGNDELLELIIDASSNVYVVGNTEASMANYDFLTIKYNSSGAQQWLQTFDGPSASGDYGKGITLDPNGDVIVTGQSFETNQWFDYMTIKYSSAGVQQWTARYNNGSNRYEDAWDVVTDNAGYVYITGQSQATGNNSTPPDCATIKYTPTGNEVWVKRYDGGFGGADDRAYCMVLDDTANVYIAGYSKNATNLDFITIKYDSSGNEEFVLRFNSQYDQNEQVNAIAERNGDIYVTGKSANAANEDFLTIRYSYSAVGIGESSAGPGSLSAYPVPTDGLLNLELSTDNSSASSIVITDVTGQTIMTVPVASGTQRMQLDVSALSAGTYSVAQVSVEGITLSRSLIIRN